MIKKIVSTSIAIGTLFIFSGCGSNNNTTPNTATGTGTAYYIDSAVSGVNYKCGSTEGVTGADGEFTFEVGSSCTFYLGDIELRAVDAKLLVDGGEIQETDVKIARVLQSLDSDGDPDNGITIDAEIIKAMEDAGITSLPDTDEELAAFEEVLKANGYELVSEEEAQAHLDETDLSLLLSEKTFYAVGQEVNNIIDIWGGTVTFNADLSEMTYTEAYAEDAGETEIVPISVDGKKLMFGNNSDGAYTVIGENKGDYIEVTDYSKDGSVESHTRFYFNQAKAEAYYQTLPDLSTLIIGKTLYQHCKDNESDWISSLTFGSDGKLVMVDREETETTEYNINGNIIYTIEGKEKQAHSVVEVTTEYIKINETSGDVTIFYFTKKAAIASPAIDCDEVFTFSTDYLNGKTFYFVQYDDFGYEDMKWNMARLKFTTNTFSWTEYDTEDTETHTFHYTIDSDGNIVYYDDNPDETETIGSPIETNDYIKVCEDGDCNTYLFFDETKARAFRDNKNDSLVPSEFTQDLVSANPWYWTGSDEGGEVWCNGTFVFDGNNNLTVSWNDGGGTESDSAPYSLEDGKLIIEHDGQVDTSTLLSVESDRLLVESEQEKPTETTMADYIWFVNKADAEAYLAEHGVASCYP